MTARIAFVRDYTVPHPDKSKDNQITLSQTWREKFIFWLFAIETGFSGEATDFVSEPAYSYFIVKVMYMKDFIPLETSPALSYLE